MNTTATSADPTAPPPPPPAQPLQPPRSSFSCDRHPNEQFNGFCPACLCERLTTLDHSSANTPSSSRRPSSASAAAAAAIKSLFSSKPNSFPPPLPPPPKPSKPTTAFFAELRRTKSYSASKNEALGLFNFEPQRKSCDVKVRSSLWSLFTLDDENKSGVNYKPASVSASVASSSSHQNHHSSCKIESCVVNEPVIEVVEDEEGFRDPENVEDGVGDFVSDNGDEIRPVQDSHLEGLTNVVEVDVNSGEIVEEEEDLVSVSSLKPMKDHIDLDTLEKKSSSGGFWSAASVFSKKWNNWRRKQKINKKQNNGGNSATFPVDKPIISKRYRETQSEIGFGRRSCDTDPRFSLDVGRISFDDPRYSFEEPRASWDGHMIGRSFPRMPPIPMASVSESTPAYVHVLRSDMQIPVEDPTMMNPINEGGEGVPGGSAQTRDYYLDSSSRRRKSLDRSNSLRKTAASVVAEVDELNMVSNGTVAVDSFHGVKVLSGERDLNSSALRDDLSETFELSSGFRDSVIGNGEIRKEAKKSSKRWGWRIWGFIQRRNGGSKDEDDHEVKYGRPNGVERSLSESWQEFRREGNEDVSGGFNRGMFRSNSSVSWRNANQIGGPFSSGRKSLDMNGNGKKRNEFVLEKNRSVRHSPNHLDNGLLRFYLTPMRGSSRRGVGVGNKIKPSNSSSIARSVLRLY